MSTLHLHFDESGDWTFGPKGSQYFVLTVVWTYDPQPLAAALTNLRFGLIKGGNSLESFHASPEKQAVRDQVVETLVAHRKWQFAGIVVEKRKVNPVLRPPERFYPQFAGSLLKFIMRGSAFQPSTSRVLIYCDTIPMDTNAKRDGVMKAIKQTCSAELPSHVHYHVFSHCRPSNKWLQVVDYCCWAMYKKWEHNNVLTYDQLRPHLAATELNVTARGDQTDYY